MTYWDYFSIFIHEIALLSVGAACGVYWFKRSLINFIHKTVAKSTLDAKDNLEKLVLEEHGIRKTNSQLDLIKGLDQPHCCRFGFASVACFSNCGELWVKEYGNGKQREGRTYRVDYCPFCGQAARLKMIP